MLLAQRQALAESIGSLEERVGESAGIEAILLRFRLESSRAVERFIDGVLDELEPAAQRPEARPLAASGAAGPERTVGPHAEGMGTA